MNIKSKAVQGWQKVETTFLEKLKLAEIPGNFLREGGSI